MSTSTMELLSPAHASGAPFADRGGQWEPRSTLEDVILVAWEDLTARGRTECPVCRGPLEHVGCAACGSSLD